MTGYHAYHQKKDDKEFGEINYLIQLVSILYWKKHYGKINLYCNQRFLESIKKYGLDKEYNEINTELLDNYPYEKYTERYWSFNKIYVAADIAKKEEAFCLIDTDLWVSKPNMFREDVDVLFYHQEAVNPDFDNTVYPKVSNWLEENIISQFDWSIAPRNSALVIFNSNFKELIEAWKDISVGIIKNNFDKKFTFINKDAHTIFIEQRLIGPLAKILGVTISEILPNTYSSIDPQWSPELGHTLESQYVATNIKHIWGLKHRYGEIEVRKLVLEVTLSAIKEIIEDRIEYNSLIEECENYLQDIKNN